MEEGGEYLTERVSLCFANKIVQKFLLRYLKNKRKFHHIREIIKLAKTFFLFVWKALREKVCHSIVMSRSLIPAPRSLHKKAKLNRYKN